MVSQAQRTQVPIQRTVDVVASYFVPTIIATSILTFILWSFFGPKPSLGFALVNAVSVLIIACPCALGLATPMSVMVSTGRGARAGILIKKADVLQSLEKIDTLVIDKTGTLTEGRPYVSSVITSANWNQSDLLAVAASLEQNSEHPLAAAIVSEANRHKLPLTKPDKFKAIAGQGVTGKVSGFTFVIGNENFLNELKILTRPLSQEADTLRQTGNIVVFVASNSQLVGLIAVKDPIKTTTPDAISTLHKEGLRIIMLTGDNKKTAFKIAEDLKIDEVKAEVTPQQKIEVVRQLQTSGCRVAMAGDGINDAPALAQAEVGIAMGTGTDVALYSAGITLVKGDLNGIVRARRLSRITMRNIRQNLFFSFFYNSLGIPLAAGVLYPVSGILLNPMIAAVAMICSSISVIANALRLRKISL
jgi:Cu+-exporting ATPase